MDGEWKEIDKTDIVNINKHLDAFNNAHCITEEIGYLTPLRIETLKATMNKKDCHMYYYEDEYRRVVSIHKYNEDVDADVIFQWVDTLPWGSQVIRIADTREIAHEQILVILRNHGHRAVRRGKLPQWIRNHPQWAFFMGSNREEELVNIRKWAKEYGLKITELEHQVEYEWL